MFDPGLSELFLIAVIALVVLGPERLPIVARKFGRFLGGIQRTFIGFQHEMQRHVKSVEEPLQDVKSAVDYGVEKFEENITENKQQLEADLNLDSNENMNEKDKV